jgi:hypothetical protein
LWWDNHHAVAKIENLRHNNSDFDDECQFLCTEIGSDTFSVGYRAYFPGNALFLRDHTLTWYRGLSGENNKLAKAGSGNIGEEPPIGSPEGGSGTAAFSTMLHSEATGEDYSRCSFSVELRVMVKTFNGYGLPSPDYDARATAAFALQVGDCGPCECEECEE